MMATASTSIQPTLPMMTETVDFSFLWQQDHLSDYTLLISYQPETAPGCSNPAMGNPTRDTSPNQLSSLFKRRAPSSYDPRTSMRADPYYELLPEQFLARSGQPGSSSGAKGPSLEGAAALRNPPLRPSDLHHPVTRSQDQSGNPAVSMHPFSDLPPSIQERFRGQKAGVTHNASPKPGLPSLTDPSSRTLPGLGPSLHAAIVRHTFKTPAEGAAPAAAEADKEAEKQQQEQQQGLVTAAGAAAAAEAETADTARPLTRAQKRRRGQNPTAAAAAAGGTRGNQHEHQQQQDEPVMKEEEDDEVIVLLEGKGKKSACASKRRKTEGAGGGGKGALRDSAGKVSGAGGLALKSSSSGRKGHGGGQGSLSKEITPIAPPAAAAGAGARSPKTPAYVVGMGDTNNTAIPNTKAVYQGGAAAAAARALCSSKAAATAAAAAVAGERRSPEAAAAEGAGAVAEGGLAAGPAAAAGPGVSEEHAGPSVPGLVEARSLPVHGAVLSAMSDYFRTLIQSWNGKEKVLHMQVAEDEVDIALVLLQFM